MPDEYPKTNITIAANGLQIEIQASESVTVRSSLSPSDSINLAVMILANKLQLVDQLQQEVNRLNLLIQMKADYQQEVERVTDET